MTPLTEQRLADDLTRAMKTRDMARVYVLRGVITAIKNLKVEKRGATLGEADLVGLIRREIRQREEAEEFATKADRRELIEQNRAERTMLEAYVPAQLDAAALEAVIREIAAAPDAHALGAIMSTLRARHAGQYDGRLASDIARKVLGDFSR